MPSKLGFEFDPWEMTGVEKPKSNIREAKRELAEFVKNKVLERVGRGESPVAGGQWKRSLSAAYKKRKSKISSALFANMELFGDMLDALEVASTAQGLEIRVVGAKQAAKADGHNNHSGRSNLPPREFIPKEGGTFKRDIIQGMKSIAKEFMDDNRSEKT